MKIRKSAVSGKFYPSGKKELSDLIHQLSEAEKARIKADFFGSIIGGIVPHAGYIYSGYEAVHFYELLKRSNQHFDTFVIVNPNHTGYGEEISLDDHDAWETPFGTVSLDKELSELLLFPYASIAHQYEHSGEVMLPLLQHFLNYDFKILPITMSKQNAYNAKLIATRLHFACKKINRKVCLIASSDFSHYVHPTFGNEQDFKVINKIMQFDTEGIFNTVKTHQITMCGYGPAAVLCEFAQMKSDQPQAELLKFGHSGEVYKSDSVVDYASILIYSL